MIMRHIINKIPSYIVDYKPEGRELPIYMEEEDYIISEE